MGYAKIKLGVEPDKRSTRPGFTRGSEATLSMLEKQLRKDGLHFVEDYENVTRVEKEFKWEDTGRKEVDVTYTNEFVIIRWGSDLTPEEQAELAESAAE